MSKFVVGTRFFEKDPSKAKKSLENITKFCKKAISAGAEHVLVAVNEEKDVSGILEISFPSNIVTVFPVKPWGHFVQPLNALLIMGRKYWLKDVSLLLASVSVEVTKDIVGALLSHMDEDTLVVGAAVEGHVFERSDNFQKAAVGREVPWNTLALWNAEMLYKYGGFSILGDGSPSEPENAGVEELVTISKIQILADSSSADAYAKLVSVPSVVWNTESFSGERLVAHEKKMASKNERPAAQLEYANFFPLPKVFHL